MFNSFENFGEIHYVTVICFLFIFITFFLKLGLAPFHQWMPDIYEGTATHVTAFLATITKLPVLGFFIILLSGPLYMYAMTFKPILLFIGSLSMLVGTFAALFQTNIKRIFAYSSLNHYGLIMLALADISFINIKIVMIYIAMYTINMLGIFSILLNLNYIKKKNSNDYLKNTNKKDNITIATLINTYNRNSYLGIALAIFFLSSAGIPPFGGFFVKFFIIQSLVENSLYIPCICVILASLISALYYLRLTAFCFFNNIANFKFKYLYIVFKKSQVNIHKHSTSLFYPLSRSNAYYISIMAYLNLFIPYVLIQNFFLITLDFI